MEQLKSLLELIATPAQKIVIIDLVNIFNRVNFTGYLYALEGLFTKVENNEIELSIALSNIFEIVTDQCYDVALAFGITLEPNIYIRDLYSIIDAIVSIEEIEDKHWVLTQLHADGDEIDKIVSLLRHHNQTVREDIFYESITRVKPSVITKLLSITEVSLEEQAQDNFDINPSIKKIISLSKVINAKYKNNESVINKFYIEKMIRNNIPLGLLFENYLSIEVLGKITVEDIEEYNIIEYVQQNDADAIATNLLGLCYISRDGRDNPQLYLKSIVEKVVSDANTIVKVMVIVTELINKQLQLELTEGGQYSG